MTEFSFTPSPYFGSAESAGARCLSPPPTAAENEAAASPPPPGSFDEHLQRAQDASAPSPGAADVAASEESDGQPPPEIPASSEQGPTGTGPHDAAPVKEEASDDDTAEDHADDGETPNLAAVPLAGGCPVIPAVTADGTALEAGSPTRKTKGPLEGTDALPAGKEAVPGAALSGGKAQKGQGAPVEFQAEPVSADPAEADSGLRPTSVAQGLSYEGVAEVAALTEESVAQPDLSESSRSSVPEEDMKRLNPSAGESPPAASGAVEAAPAEGTSPESSSVASAEPAAEDEENLVQGNPTARRPASRPEGKTAAAVGLPDDASADPPQQAEQAAPVQFEPAVPSELPDLDSVEPANRNDPLDAGRLPSTEAAGARSAAGTESHSADGGPPARDTAASDQADRVRFVERVARAFEAAADRGGPVRLRLHPPELGSLRVELTIQRGAVSARLETETEAARAAIVDNLPALRERLAEHNLRVERFEVNWSGQSPGGLPQQSGGQPAWRDREGRSASPVAGRGAEQGSDAGRRPAARPGGASHFDVVI